MIVMLSALRETSVFPAWRSPGPHCPGTPHRVPRGPVPHRAAPWAAQPVRLATPAGQAHCDISPVDNGAPGVDDLIAKSFFLTHPVDGITPGS
jgi:hypothetical protein